MTDNTWRAFGTFVVLLGCSTLAIPKYIFPICEADDLFFLSSYHPIMRCYWFGQVEIILGLIVILAGSVVIYRPASDVRLFAGVMLVGLGFVIVAVSTNLIIGSTCGHSHSLCQTGTKPAERVAGVVIVLAGLGLILSSRKRSTQR
ncbi:MAG: DUF4418 family protein [Planctomycetota bacterium]